MILVASRVSIIGSFQKYYEGVIKIIRFFRNNGLWVLSPKDSRITGKIEDFVIFESDNQHYTPEEIQMITLDRILSSEAVYVYNPEGYVGRTTCYEIGFCYSRAMPIYFFSMPKDLPIPVLDEQVLSPESFVERFIKDECKFYQKLDMCDPAIRSFKNIMGITSTPNLISEKNIVICGSMMFFDKMISCQKELQQLGINSTIPKEESDAILNYSEEEFRLFKRKVSNSYLRKIRDKNTIAVLIINETKNGIPNYIGANTLVELAMAFMWNRRIFIYNDIYEPLADELLAWNSICLKGDLTRIVQYIFDKEQFVEEKEQYPKQISFFEI